MSHDMSLSLTQGDLPLQREIKALKKQLKRAEEDHQVALEKSERQYREALEKANMDRRKTQGDSKEALDQVRQDLVRAQEDLQDTQDALAQTFLSCIPPVDTKMSAALDIPSKSESSHPSVSTGQYPAGSQDEVTAANNDESSNTVADTSTGSESYSDQPCHIFKLPNELLSRIMDSLYNWDLVCFAMAHRRFHILGRRALQEHQQLTSAWTTISNVNKPPGYLAEQVISQFKNPRLLSYTHCLDVVFEEPRLSFDSTGRALDSHIREAISDQARPFVNEQFLPRFWEIWTSDVKRSNIAAILCAWTQRLEDVTSLNLHLNGLQRELLLDLFDPSSVYWPESFENLQSICIDQCTVEPSPLSYRLLESSARLISVTNLTAVHITLHKPTDHPISSHFVSDVNSFILEHCYLGTRHLVALISNMHSLGHFSHEEDWIGAAGAPYTDRTAVIDSLRIVACRTLTSLCLIGRARAWEQRDTPLGSLEDFEILQCVTLEFQAFCKTLQEQPSETPCTQLPRSIEWLKLVSSSGMLEAESIKTVLKALLHEIREGLPNLEDIIVIGIEKAEVRALRAATIVRGLEAVGVKIALKSEEANDNDGREEDDDDDDNDGTEEDEEMEGIHGQSSHRPAAKNVWHFGDRPLLHETRTKAFTAAH